MRIPGDPKELARLYSELEKALLAQSHLFKRLAELLPEDKTIEEHFTEEQVRKIAEEVGFTPDMVALVRWHEDNKEELDKKFEGLAGKDQTFH